MASQFVRAIPTLSALIACGLGAPAAHAVVAPTPTTPAAGARVASSLPRFAWNLNDNYAGIELEVSASSAEGADGRFTNLIHGGSVGATSSSVSMPANKRLWAGRWYWHVFGYGADQSNADSPTMSFVIPPRIYPAKIRGTVTRKGVQSGSILINSNTQSVRVRVKGKVGTKSCVNQAVGGTQLQSRLGVWYKGVTFYCRSTRNLPAGTKITVQATTTGSGVTRTSSRTFRTPGATGAG
jgi:hypothetical protein